MAEDNTPEIVHINTPLALMAQVPHLIGMPWSDLDEALIVIAFDEHHRSLGAARMNLPVGQDAVHSALPQIATVIRGVDNFDHAEVVIVTTDTCRGANTDHILEHIIEMDDMGILDVSITGVVGSDGYITDPTEVPRDKRELMLEDPDRPSPESSRIVMPERSTPERREFMLALAATLPSIMAERDENPDPTEFYLSAIEDESLTTAARLMSRLQSGWGAQGLVLTAGWGAELGHLHHRGLDTGLEVTDEEHAVMHALGGMDFPRPNVARLKQAIDAVASAASYLGEGDAHRDQAWVAIAFMLWFQGKASAATDALLKVTDAQDLGVQVLGSQLQAGRIPEWAQRKVPHTELGLAWAARVS